MPHFRGDIPAFRPKNNNVAAPNRPALTIEPSCCFLVGKQECPLYFTRQIETPPCDCALKITTNAIAFVFHCRNNTPLRSVPPIV